MAQNLAALTTLTPQVLASTRPSTTAETTVLTVPGSSGAIIKTGVLCNTGAAAATVSLSVVPSGGTAGAANRVLSGYSLAAGDTVSLADYLAGTCLGAGDFVSVLVGTANTVVVTLTGTVNS